MKNLGTRPSAKKPLQYLLILLLALIVCGSAAADGEWTFDKNNYIVTGYTGAGGDVDIPGEMEGCPSEILGGSLFYGNESITGVTVPENCNTLSYCSFYMCENLASASLPDTLQIIGASAFYDCRSLTEIVIPAAVGYIGDSAFSDCDALRSIAFKGEVPNLGGSQVFADLPGDAVFYVPDDRVNEYTAVLPAGAVVQGSGAACVTVSYLCAESDFEFDAATGTIVRYKKYDPIVSIPAAIGGVPVKAIGDEAFNGHRYAYRVDIPEGVEHIGVGVFGFAQVLECVNLPSTLKTIGDEAFLGFKGRQITFPDGLESIGARAFRYAPFTRISLGSGIRHIGSEAFLSCSSLKSVYIGAHTLPEIAPDAFSNCRSLADIDLYTGCTKAEMLALQADVDALGLTCRVWRMQNPDVSYPQNGTMTFDGNGYVTGYTGTLTHVRPWDFFDGVPTIGIADGAFKGNQVIRYFGVNYNDLVTSIGANAFQDSTLETVDLFDSVTTIGAGAFENTPLTTVKGGSALTSIGERAFANTNLTNFVIPVNVEVAYNAFEGVPTQNLRLSADATDEQVAAWSEALGCPWNAPILRVGETPTTAEMPFAATDERFFEIDASTGHITAYTGTDVNVVVPRSVGGVTVTGIEYSAFECARDYTNTETASDQTDWVRMRSVVLPETVTYIADSAFSYCQQLETFVCYGALESAGSGTFMLCRGLNNVVFVNGVKAIGNWCFDNAGPLRNAYFGHNLESIGVRAFNLCAMEHFVADAKTVASEAFYDCPNLAELHFTDRCESIEAGAVSGCPKLNTVCLETTDLAFIPEDGICYGESGGSMTICTPESLSAEAQTVAARVVGWMNPMPTITYAVDARVHSTGMPDVAALLAADGAAQQEPGVEGSAAAAPAKEPKLTQTGEYSDRLEQRYVLDTAVMSGFTMTSDMMGGAEYSILFHEDKTCELVFAGSAFSMPWKMTTVETEAGSSDAFEMEMYGIKLLAVVTEEGFDLDYMNSMLIHFVPKQ